MRSLLLLLTLLLLASCSDSSGAGQPSSAESSFRLQGCTLCHGSAGEGTAQGPPLRGLAAHWSREELAAYLANPRARVQQDARLGQIAARFPMEMPAVKLGHEELLALSDYTLGLEARHGAR